MTTMTRMTLIAGLLGVALLSGCATAPISRTSSQPMRPSETSLGAKSLDLEIQASVGIPTSGWKQSDIDKYVVTLRDSQRFPTEVVLHQKGLSEGETAKSKVRFNNLRLGEFYTVKVEAWSGSQIINSQHPSEAMFIFTGDQDVEDVIEKSITILLDPVSFSGTLRIPMTEQFFLDVFGNDKTYFDNSTKLEFSLVRMGGDGAFSGTYVKPGSGYRDYLLTNLGRGYKYKLTLTNHFMNGRKVETLSKTIKEFTPFDSASSTDSYTLSKSDFK